MKKTKARELGITKFPYRETDKNDNQTYWENSNGDWYKWRYNEKGKITYYESCIGQWWSTKFNNNGYETYKEWYTGEKEYVIR